MSKIMMDGFERDDFSVSVPPKEIKCFVSSILTDPVNPNIAIFLRDNYWIAVIVPPKIAIFRLTGSANLDEWM